MADAREGEGGALNSLHVIYGWQHLQIPALHPRTHTEIRCSYPPFATALIKQLPPNSAAFLSNTSLKNHTFKHFFAYISLDYNISSSTITPNPDVHCLGCKVLTLPLCTGAYRNKKPAAACLQKLCLQKLKMHPTVPYLLSKKVSYVSSMKIASILFQIPCIFQPAVNNKACILALESV